ncbi:kinesin-like protein KIN-14N [Silene latifolia]|uniref:kinesin-like protein KIN-14N n=1 Tax=Silene latifolia TaxID=37657 RepID=UPI003D7802C3
MEISDNPGREEPEPAFKLSGCDSFENMDEYAIIYSLELNFDTSKKQSAQGWNYDMQASVLEIHNNTIRDLSVSNRINNDKKHEIKTDANGDQYVFDLNSVDVCSSEEAALLLKQAAECRSVGKT